MHSFDTLVHVSSASYAYPSLDGAARARVADALGRGTVPAGVFVLSTCLRVEIAVAGNAGQLAETLKAIFPVERPASPQIRLGEDAVKHLFSVAAGLESPVVGEVEILTQFRQALHALRQSHATPGGGGVGRDGGFLKILESAVATGREFRAGLEISPHDTMAALAAQMVGSESAVAVVGSGTMAKAVVGALLGLPAPPRVAMVVRSPEKVNIDDVEVLGMDRLEAVLESYRAIISATAASTHLLEPEKLQRVLNQSKLTPTLVDMAMPPDFTAPPDGAVDYVAIDDLAAMAAKRPRVTDGERSVMEAAAAAHDRLIGTHAGPAIAVMLAGADAVVEEAVSRFSGRLTDPADREVLLQTAHTVARTLMNGPVSAVRTSRDPRLVETIKAVFVDE